MTQRKVCPNCGQKTMQQQLHRHVEEVGRFRVNDATGMAMTCTNCGEWTLSLQELAAYERRAARLVLMERTDADGAVLKYARKALGLKQADLALLLKCAPETLSRTENSNDAVPRTLQLAIVSLIDQVMRGEIDLAALVQAARESLPPAPAELEVRKAI